jgi:hypothetical protein
VSELREKVARAICAADRKAPEPDAPIYIGMTSAKAWEGRLEMADAAIAVMQQEHERCIELAMGRVQEVWTRLGRPAKDIHSTRMCWDEQVIRECRCSLLWAMSGLLTLLPAERASVWKAKHERVQG